VGKEKVSDKHLNDLVSLQIGDVRNLSIFKDNMFDIVTMSFGIRNVPEKEVALCQIFRVLQKKEKTNTSGTLAILEFSEPGEGSGILGYIARLFIHYIVPIMGAALSGAPREYMHLQNSIREFPSPTVFAQLIESSQCGKDRKGSFRVEKVIPLNFNSVHVYIAKPIIHK
jgi:demethylmenaquinone methyltransferase/2-methoxy-6-polyprenyl-1,4-benzoquinol methylase